MTEPLSAREQVAAGPAFVAAPGLGNCRCGLIDELDVYTGLCRDCWKCWRWAAKREEGRPGAPAQPAHPVETS